jgi:hypothetical protein
MSVIAIEIWNKLHEEMLSFYSMKHTSPNVSNFPSYSLTLYFKLSRLGTSHPIRLSTETDITPVLLSIEIHPSGVPWRGLKHEGVLKKFYRSSNFSRH